MDNDADNTQLGESLRVQLAELNKRGRWYSSELWHVPFAYLTLSGILIAQIADKWEQYVPPALIVSGVFGVFVAEHMRRLRRSEQRAIQNLIDTEKALNLPVTAQTRMGWKVFQVLVLFTVLACFVTSVYLLCGSCPALLTLAVAAVLGHRRRWYHEIRQCFSDTLQTTDRSER